MGNDGEPISYTSLSCKNNAFIHCPSGAVDGNCKNTLADKKLQCTQAVGCVYTQGGSTAVLPQSGCAQHPDWGDKDTAPKCTPAQLGIDITDNIAKYEHYCKLQYDAAGCIFTKDALSGPIERNHMSDRECGPCPDGTWSADGGQNTCEAWAACSTGLFEYMKGTPQSDRVCCRPCPAGKEAQYTVTAGKCDVTSAPTCTACAQGLVKVGVGAHACKPCPTGYYASLSGDACLPNHCTCPESPSEFTTGPTCTKHLVTRAAPRVKSHCADAIASTMHQAMTTMAAAVPPTRVRCKT
jgi:hypothetical protein